MAAESVVLRNTEIYSFGKGVTWLLLHTLLPVRYHGKEKLRNLKGPAILIGNHLHALDPMVLGLPVPEQCVFLSKKELAKNPLMERVLRDLHCVFVDRHHTDMEAMRAVMKVLREGKILMIFPEGTRHHEGQMEQIESGTSLIALRGGAPLIPVYLDNPLRLFRPVNAWVGDPIPTEDLRSQGVNRETCEALNERIRETYRRMIRESEEASRKG